MSKKPNRPWSKAKGKREGPPRPASPRRRKRRDASAAILALARPVLDLFGEDASAEELEDVLLDVALLWNVAVHEHVFGGHSAAETYLDGGVPPGAAPELVEPFRDLLRRKREEHPFDARWIGWTDVYIDRDGGVALRAEEAPADALTREGAEAVLDALSDLDPLTSLGLTGDGGAPPAVEPTAVLEAGAADPWRSILESARDIHALAPWEVLSDGDVFGLRVEGEPEVHWCSVMGAAGEFFGVTLFEGAEGFEAFRRLAVEGDREAGLAGFDGFLLSYDDREDLTAAERRRIEDAGVRFRGRAAWPHFHTQRKGRLASALRPEDEARLQPLLKALALVLEVRCNGFVPDDLDLDGGFPVWDFGADGFAFRSEFPGEPPEVDLPPVDRVGVARLLAAADRADAVLEFGGVAMPARIEDDDGLEYVPFLFLATDAATGVLLPPRMAEIGAREAECAPHLLGILTEAEVLPREIHVASHWIERAIAPLAEALSIRLVRSGELRMFDEAAASMVSFMESRR